MTRARSQSRQNGAVVDAITPKTRPSGRTNRSAGAVDPGSSTAATSPNRVRRRSSSSARGTTVPLDQCVAPPTSMYSMNRTSAEMDAAKSSSGSSSSSLTPRMITASSLVPSNTRAAAWMPRITLA